MSVASKFPVLSVTLTAGILAFRFAVAGYWLWAVLSLLLGLLWWLEIRQNQGRSAHALLIGFLGLTLIGLHMGLGAVWMLCGVIASLSTWDLHHFSHRLQFVKQDEAAETLVSHHIRRLLIIDSLGFLLAGIALGLRLTIAFGLILFLAALAIVCLSRFVRFFRQESD